MEEQVARRFAVRVDPVLGGLMLLSVAIVPLFLSGAAGSRTSWAVQTLLDVWLMVLAFRLAALTREQRHSRRFWRAVAVAGGLCVIGDGYQTVAMIVGAVSSVPTVVQTCFVVTGMLIAVVTMLLHPLGAAGRQRLRLWLDAATVLVAVAVFLWYFTVADAIGSRDDSKLIAAAATSASMLLVTFALLKLTLGGTAPFTRGPGLLASVGVAGTAVAASLPVGGSPGLAYIVQLVPCLLMPISLRWQQLQTTRRPRPAGPEDGRRSSRLPYVAVAAVQLLLVASLTRDNSGAAVWGVGVGATLITVIVIARQMAALTDNERLLAEVDRGLIEVRDQREWFRSLVQHASDVTVVVDLDGTIRYATPASGRVLGIDAEALIGTRLSDRVTAADRPRLAELTLTKPGSSATAQVRMRHADGSERWLRMVATDLTGNPSVNGVVINAHDITEARRLTEQLRHQATHDALTGLANRALLDQRLADLPGGGTAGLLLIDLDGFKPINDRYGHHAGDEVLIAVARRLRDAVGETGTTVRMGGDEFAVLLPATDQATANRLADTMAAAVAEPIPLVTGPIRVGASIGVAVGAHRDARQLLRDADAAMYRQKALL